MLFNVLSFIAFVQKVLILLNFKSVWIIVMAHAPSSALWRQNVMSCQGKLFYFLQLQLVKILPSALHTKYVALDPLIKHISVPPVIEFVLKCSSSIYLFFRVLEFFPRNSAFTVWKTLKSIGSRSGLYCAWSSRSKPNKSKLLIALSSRCAGALSRCKRKWFFFRATSSVLHWQDHVKLLL